MAVPLRGNDNRKTGSDAADVVCHVIVGIRKLE